jgi:folate-binding protein YgfZ
MIHEAWQSFLARTDTAPAQTAASATGTTTRGIAWLPELTIAAFEGADVRRFLQGYLTCDTAALDSSRFLPTAICSLKGRVVVNGWCIAPHPQQVLFVIHASLFDPLQALLQVYLRFSRTRLANLGDHQLVFGGLNLEADAAGAPVDTVRRLILCTELAEAERLWQTHPHLAAGAWQRQLIADGMPMVTAATTDTFLPQMLDLPALGAINFNKGCYLGQEVVARAQHRGQVKRHLVRLEWVGTDEPVPGAELADAAGRTRGVIVQTTEGTGAGTALAVVQDDTEYPLHFGTAVFTAAG